MPLFNTVTDSFDTALAAFWSAPGAATTAGVSVVGGRARIPTSTTTATAEALRSPYGYTLQGSYVSGKIWAPDSTGATTNCYTRMLVRPNAAGIQLRIRHDPINGLVHFENLNASGGNIVASTDTGVSSVTREPDNMRWNRIIESAGKVQFQTSANGYGWTTRRTVDTPAWVTDAATKDVLRIEFSTLKDTGTADFGEVDDVNILQDAPAQPSGSGFIGMLLALPGGPPTHYYPLNNTYQARDVIGTLDGTAFGSPVFEAAGCKFNGTNYIELPNSRDFSLGGQTAPKDLTIVAFMTVENWATTTKMAQGYCHWMGKGTAGNHEWVMRYYPSTDTARPRRTSAYHYTPTDVLNNQHQGAGSYFQKNIGNNVEMVIVSRSDVYTTSGVSGAGTAWPGSVDISHDGYTASVSPSLGYDHDGFVESGGGTPYQINPQYTTAPVRIGTRDKASYLIGRVRRVAFFNRKLTNDEITTIYSNRALAEGEPGTGGSGLEVPGAPGSIIGSRDTEDATRATITWTAPSVDGGSPITGYVVSRDGNDSANSGPYSNDAIPASQSTFTFDRLLNTQYTFSVAAKNAQGAGPTADLVIPEVTTVTLPLLGSQADAFDTASLASAWVASAGVTQAAGAVTFPAPSTNPSFIYRRGDMRNQSVFFKITPVPGSGVLTGMFIRSTNDASQKIRIFVRDGTLYSAYEQGGLDTGMQSRPYNAVSDEYWRIWHDGTVIRLETSSTARANSWTALGRSGFNNPAWLDDAQVGVEVFSGGTF